MYKKKFPSFFFVWIGTWPAPNSKILSRLRHWPFWKILRILSGLDLGVGQNFPKLVRIRTYPPPRFSGVLLKSSPVSVLLPFLEGPQTGPVPESFRMQEPWTRTAKNCKKPVETGCNWSRNEYNKTHAILAKIGHKLWE